MEINSLVDLNTLRSAPRLSNTQKKTFRRARDKHSKFRLDDNWNYGIS